MEMWVYGCGLFQLLILYIHLTETHVETTLHSQDINNICVYMDDRNF